MKNMDHESRINAALGKIVRNFNFLEMNLGLCIRCLKYRSNPSDSDKYLTRNGIINIVNDIKSVIEKCEHISDTSEFENWTESLEEIRNLRNYYVHATWEYIPLREEAPLEFAIPPWRKEKIQGRENGLMQIEDLEADAKRVELAFKRFTKIRKKYRI